MIKHIAPIVEMLQYRPFEMLPCYVTAADYIPELHLDTFRPRTQDEWIEI